MKLKKLLAFGLALVMCLAMAACGTNPDEKTDAEPVSITVTENWDFSVGFYPVITPMVSSTYGAGFWSRNFYNTLVSYDDNGKIQGELAETWEISDDGKTYTFHLRDGVKFSDGTPLTSEAVKMTLEAVVTHLGPQNGAFGKLTTLFDKLETPDEKTFVMTLKTPYYAALDNLTMALPLGIVNPAAFEGGVEKAYENCVSATMGTGPYMFDRVEGDTYTFIRNPYYWGEAPEVDEFKVKVIPDNAAKILALRNGEIDAILGSSRLSAEGYTEISQDAAFGHAMDDSTNQTRYLGMNLNKAPFNDPLVREAVSYAVNQQELETSVFDGLETAAETLFTNEKPNCGVEVKTYPTDMEKAKQLMKEAGYEDTNDDGILEKDGTSLAILLAIKVKDDIVHLLADAGIVGQHLVTEACGGAIRKFLAHTLEKGFGIGKLLCIAIGKGHVAHQRLVPRHVLPLDIQIIGRTVAVIIARRRIAAQAVAVALRFHDVTVVLCPAAADFPAVFIAETLHSEAVFQHTLPQRVHDLLQLQLERGAVQLLRATGPPCMPELIAAAPEVHADMSNGTQPFIFFRVRGIK